jgi:hypothetical protein
MGRESKLRCYVGFYADEEPNVVLEKLKLIVGRQRCSDKVPVVKFAQNSEMRSYFFLGVTELVHMCPTKEVWKILELLGCEKHAWWPMDIKYIQWWVKGSDLSCHYFEDLPWDDFAATTKPALAKVADAPTPSLLNQPRTEAAYPTDPFDLTDADLPDQIQDNTQIDHQYDQLLYWLSARVEGSWGSFVNACNLLGLIKDLKEARYVLRRMMLLGHVECSHDGSRWSVSAPAIVQSSSNRKFLCGQRTPDLLEKVSAHSALDDRPQPGHQGPTHIEMSRGSLQDGDSIPINESIEVVFAGKSSEKLSKLLPDLSGWKDLLTSIDKLNPYNYDFEIWRSEGFVPCDGIIERHNVYTGESGLYNLKHKFTGLSASLFFDFDRQRWLKGDWYGLRFLSLQCSAKKCAVFYDSRSNQLSIPVAQHWPALYERALVLASGFLPRRSSKGDWLVYQDVSAELSLTLANKLNVSREEMEHA